MKSLNIKTVLIVMCGLALVACRPAKQDPPFQYDHAREDAKVDHLELGAGNPLSMIGAPALWKKTTGKRNDGNRVIIGVVGTGVDYNVPDLRDALWVNLGELGDKKAQNNQDDDLNGYKDDVVGYDFFSGDGLPFDWHGHDTFTASLIAATARTNAKVVGVAPNAALMVARYLGPDGRGSGFDAVAALEYVISGGASVVYFNWPQGGFKAEVTPLLIATLKQAGEKNILVVIPAGNSSNQRVPSMMKEAAKLENVLVVSGLDKNGRLTATTNFGKSVSDLGAPAEGALGYLPGGNVSSEIKTSSVAAAYVTGAAALISTLPQYGSALKVKEALIRMAQSPRADQTLNVLSEGALSLGKF